MLHVVFDARSVADHYPGIGRYGSGLTHALAQRADVRLTLLVDPAAANTFHSLPDVECVAAPYRLSGLGQQWAVPALVRRLAPDVYHSPYYLMPYRMSCPVVVTFYDLIPLLVAGTHSLYFRLLYRVTHRLAAAAARRMIAISQVTAADLIRCLGFPAEKITTIMLGVDSDFRPSAAKGIAALHRRHTLPDGYALFVGTNKPHKNLARLIEAWAQAEPSETLVVAGREDPRYPGAMDLATKFGVRVLVLGGVSADDLPVLYAAARFFVFPSLYEGFGLPVLEAMASGTPVVCSNTASLPEVAGDAALLVDPCDVSALAGAVSRLSADAALRADLRERGLARAIKYTWERTAAETVAVYARCVAERR